MLLLVIKKWRLKETSGMFLHKIQANIIHWNFYFVLMAIIPYEIRYKDNNNSQCILEAFQRGSYIPIIFLQDVQLVINLCVARTMC